MNTPTIAEEVIAKKLALWHGQVALYRDVHGTTITVAASRTVPPDRATGWGWELDRYVERHWREYIAAAREIIADR